MGTEILLGIQFFGLVAVFQPKLSNPQKMFKNDQKCKKGHFGVVFQSLFNFR